MFSDDTPFPAWYSGCISLPEKGRYIYRSNQFLAGMCRKNAVALWKKNEHGKAKKVFRKGEMTMLKQYSPKLQAALGFLALQFLFKITFELDGGAQSVRVPLIYFVWFFIPMLILIILLCLLRQRSGYVLGIIYSLLHLPLVLSLIFTNNVPAGNSLLKPFNVMVTCSFIAYFLFLEYACEKKEDAKKMAGNSALITLYFNLCWISLMIISIFTTATRNANLSIPSLSGDALNNPFAAVFLAISGIATICLIFFMILGKKGTYQSVGVFGVIQIIALMGLMTAAKITLIVTILGSLCALAVIIFSWMEARKTTMIQV